MPPSVLFTSLLLILHLTYSHAIRTVSLPISDITQQCIFELGGYAYDLCPLIGGYHVIARKGMIMDENEENLEDIRPQFYELTLGGLRSSSDDALITQDSANPGCDEDVWVCTRGTETPNTKHEPSRSREPHCPLKKRKRRKCTSQITANLVIDEDKSEYPPLLRLSFNTEQWTDRQALDIAFFCSDSDNVKFVDKDNGVLSFIWLSPHGCSSQPSLSILQEATEGSDKLPTDDSLPGEDNKEDDLIPVDNSRSRRWIAFFVVFLILAAFSGFIVASSKARSFTSKMLSGIGHTLITLLCQAFITLRPIGKSLNNMASKSIVRLGSRFRQGDNQLVRWAQEDMSLEDTEDVMVNGGPSDPYDEEGMDEYIPLTISPRFGKRQMRSYGTTPDVETFEERGLKNGFSKIFGK